jgi:flavin reductase (DIM6/NTAB) family NADH-FMN oxidoreductase RutF
MATTLSSASSSSSAHMVVNLLSSHQSSTAIMFSRPDLYPVPFEASDVRYSLSEEGLPILKGVVGALSCRLVRKGIPLHDLDGNGFESKEVVLETGSVSSELFIARVVRVESIGERESPLVYHQRGYTTCPPKSRSARLNRCCVFLWLMTFFYYSTS